MKKNDVKTWVKALRSGEYKQCSDRLHDGTGYCCLGVMIDVLVDGYWERCNSCWIFDNGSQYPSDRVRMELSISNYAIKTLSCLNDKGEEFNYIADFIELNMDKLDLDYPFWDYPK